MIDEAPIGTWLGPIQLALREVRARGWLVYDVRGQSAVALRLFALPEGGTERRFFYWIPAEGLPVAIVHDEDASSLPELPGEHARYRTAIELRAALEAHVPREGVVLIEHAPFGQVADLARVDEATLSLLRGRETTVRSSIELVNRFAGPLLPRERGEVREVASALSQVRVALETALASRTFTRWELLWSRLEAEADAQGLVLSSESGIAIDEQTRGQRALVRTGPIEGFVSARLDLWARKPHGARVWVPSSWDLTLEAASERSRSAAATARTVEDELLTALAPRAKLPRVLGSEVAELAHDVVRRRGLAFTSSCVGWPLGPLVRGSHACTFDAEGFADPRELVPGTVWALRLGVAEPRSGGLVVAWRTSLLERLEHGVDVLARAADVPLVVRHAPSP